MTKHLHCAAVFVSFYVAVAQQSYEVLQHPASTTLYTLNAGDVIEFKFSYNSDMNERVTIRPDGFISLSMIGDVRARGMIPEDLAKDVERRYSGILKHPEAVVIVRDFAAQRIFISGEINVPGVLPLSGRLTFAQALVQAGGSKPSAKLNEVLLLRYQGSSRASVQVVRGRRILNGMEADIPLEPYDVIFIPKTTIARAGQFVEQYINALVPKALLFPYNLNNVLSVRQ